MKDKLSQIALKAGRAVSAAANKTVDYVQTHKPTEQDLAQAKAMVLKAGKVVADETVALGKEMAQSKTFKDAAKGAGVGAVTAIPIPIIGPAVGAVIGAGAGIYLGSRSQPHAQPPALSSSLPQAVVIDVEAAPPKDLYAELLKLDELRQKSLLTNEEFEVQKQKLLQRT